MRLITSLLISSAKLGRVAVCVASPPKFYSTMSTATEVSIPSGSSPLPGHVFTPKSKNGDTKKGLVVIQEWWGINDQIKEEAAEICRDGNFVTLVPDLYRGKVTDDREEAGHLMEGLDWAGALQDIKQSVKYLKETLKCEKVGVTGFCMGGALTLAVAASEAEIAAAAPFYGIPGGAAFEKIKIPLQCHFGLKDQLVGFSSKKDQDALKAKLDAAKVKYEFHEYDADHAFTNTTGPNYNPEAAKLALKRMYAFMQKNLS